MTTGTSVPPRTPSTVASVAATGRSKRIGRPQLPHFGRSARRARATRFSVAQNGHATVALLPTFVTDTGHAPPPAIYRPPPTTPSAPISPSIPGPPDRGDRPTVPPGRSPRENSPSARAT